MRLLESTHRPRRSRAGTALSVIAHAAVIGGAVAATAAGTPAPDPEPVDAIHYAAPTPAPTPAPRPPETPPGPPRPTAPTVPTLDAPPLPPVIEIPATIPPPGDPTAGLAETFASGVTRGAPSEGPANGSGVGSGSDAPHDVLTVERAALPLGAVRPRYPEVLRAAGIEGRAALRFVVDTLGRVEPGSVRAVAATHPAFGQAALAAVESLRFRPAEAGGRKVRQLVELPFEFRLR